STVIMRCVIAKNRVIDYHTGGPTENCPTPVGVACECFRPVVFKEAIINQKTCTASIIDRARPTTARSDVVTEQAVPYGCSRIPNKNCPSTVVIVFNETVTEGKTI